MPFTQGIKFLYQYSVGEYDYDNPGSNVISVTSQAAGDHDKVNLTTNPLRQTWRSATLDPQEIVIHANDLTDAPDVFALLNHNLSDEAVVILYASFSTDFTVPALTLPFQWNEKHMAIVTDLGLAYPYYKIKIIDPTNGCGFIEVGRIVAGKSLTFTNNEDIADSFQVSTQDLASQTPTEGFFRASNERVKIETLSVTIPKIDSRTGSNDNYTGFTKMTKFVGTTLPFLTIVDPFDAYFVLHWGQAQTVPSRSYNINRYTDFTLSVQEVY